MLFDEHDVRAFPREFRRTLRELLGKCTGCAWPACTICTRDHCPQGIAIARAHYRETMAELERTCHTPEEWVTAGGRLLAKAAEQAAQLEQPVKPT
jgi:hypothetical protein